MAWDSMYETLAMRNIASRASTRMQNTLGSTRLTIVGADAMIRTLSKDIPEATQNSIIGVVEQAASVVLLRADELVPVDTGDLIQTGRVVPASLTSSRSISASSYRVAIEYGNEDVPYAVYVHEDVGKLHGAALNFMHEMEKGKRKYNNVGRAMTTKRPWHTRRPQEQAKFMDAAFLETQETVRSVMEAGLRRAIMRILKNPKRYGYTGAHDPALGNYATLRREYDYGRY